MPHHGYLVLVVHSHFRQVCCLHRAHHRQVLLQQQARAHRQRAGPRAGRQGLGSGENPDCRLLHAQLESLDFAAMDLSEFYASIVPTLPSVGTIQGSNASRLTTCYYGQGKCQ